MTWWPLHSWHPVMVHLPLAALLLAVVFDLMAAQRRSSRWRDPASAPWWVGLLGMNVAVATGRWKRPTLVQPLCSGWPERLPWPVWDTLAATWYTGMGSASPRDA